MVGEDASFLGFIEKYKKAHFMSIFNANPSKLQILIAEIGFNIFENISYQWCRYVIPAISCDKKIVVRFPSKIVCYASPFCGISIQIWNDISNGNCWFCFALKDEVFRNHNSKETISSIKEP